MHVTGGVGVSPAELSGKVVVVVSVKRGPHHAEVTGNCGSGSISTNRPIEINGLVERCLYITYLLIPTHNHVTS
jgi:hypothetical protein